VLSEIFQSPLPEALAAAAAPRYKTFAELDATVWRHLTPDVCSKLAVAAIKHLQPKLSRLPPVVRDRKISDFGVDLQNGQLQLGRRAMNCLQTLLDYHPEAAAKTTVGDLSRWRNMGVKSLMDVLCALESRAPRSARPIQLDFGLLVSQPQDDTKTSPIDLPSQIVVEVSRYPRPGQKLAPRALATFLDVPTNDRRISSIRLKDLDESCWEKLSSHTCRKLAQAVADRMQRAGGSIAKIRHMLLRLPHTKGLPLRLQLEQRTFNCLRDAGLIASPDKLEGIKVGELLKIPNFGGKCLLDLLVALESHAPPLYRVTPKVTSSAHRLYRLRAAEQISIEDPRFGLELQSLSAPGQNLKEIAQNILTSSVCPMEPKLYVSRMDNLRARVRAAASLTLERELSDLLSFEKNPRNRAMSLRHLGWAGGAPEHLELVGQTYRVSREFVRQVCKSHMSRLAGKRPFLPILDQVLQQAKLLVPCTQSHMEKSVHELKLTASAFKLEGLMSVARHTSREAPFALQDFRNTTYAVPPSMGRVPKLLSQIARKSVSRWGATTIDDLIAQAHALTPQKLSTYFVRAFISCQEDFHWLDEASGWFWLQSPRNALLNQIEKILSVSSRIHISELRQGVSRHHRREGFAPPQRVLLALCQQASACGVEGGFVCVKQRLDYREILADTERAMVDVLKENGSILDRQRFEALCLQRGIERGTFYIYLSYSPVIVRYAPGVYALRGADILPGYAESLVANKPKIRVIADYGWTNDARIFLRYQLSDSVLLSGVVYIPAKMRPFLAGNFRLQVSDGLDLGTLVIRNGRAMGLTPLFRRRGGETGDTLTITLDLKKRIAVVELAESGSDEASSTPTRPEISPVPAAPASSQTTSLSELSSHPPI
jgi:hypothetical protein